MSHWMKEWHCHRAIGDLVVVPSHLRGFTALNDDHNLSGLPQNMGTSRPIDNSRAMVLRVSRTNRHTLLQAR